MLIERARISADHAARELAARRAALDEAIAAVDRGDPDADPIAVVDRVMAVHAAEAVVEMAAARRQRVGRGVPL